MDLAKIMKSKHRARDMCTGDIPELLDLYVSVSEIRLNGHYVNVAWMR